MGGDHKWQNSFCSCSNHCCIGFWCPCILAGRTHYRLDHPDMSGFSSCNGWCCGLCLCIGTPIGVVMMMMQRSNIQKKYNLEGGCCGNCLRAWCCTCCELIQEENEVVDKENAKSQPAGYRPVQGMQYAAPQ